MRDRKSEREEGERESSIRQIKSLVC